jgi:hypothetical protein
MVACVAAGGQPRALRGTKPRNLTVLGRADGERDLEGHLDGGHEDVNSTGFRDLIGGAL